MKLKKNDVVELTIEDMSYKGEGIGKAEGYPLFIKDTVIGDRLQAIVTKVGKSYGYGRIKEILVPSSDRIEPLCPSAGPCGGCQLQALAYEKQLEFKENMIRSNLKRIGGFDDPPMEPIIGMEEPFHYRNKAQFPVGLSKDGRIITGFYAGRTHRIIENRCCFLGSPINETILNRVIAYMEECRVAPYDEQTGEGLVRHILIRCGFSSGQIMVCLVLNGRALPQSSLLIERLTSLPGMTSIVISVNRKKTNVIMGDEILPLWGQTFITDTIGGIRYRISALSFYQVNPVQTEKLYELALEYAGLTGKEIVWDLYCGIGTISLFLAQKAGKVYGVEIVPAAIEDARRNAALNGIKNVEFFVGKAEEVLPEWWDAERKKKQQRECEESNRTAGALHADVIVVDPPRKGCDERLLATIVQMQPQRIVYVSCDSATLARDLKYLCGKGYELVRVRGCDQFCQTVHTEACVLLVRSETQG